VTHYTVSYREKTNSQENQKTKQTKGNETFLTVEGLQANTVYQFKIRAECEVGASKYGDIVEAHTPKPPIDRLAVVMKNISEPIASTEPNDLPQFRLPQKNIFKLSEKMIRKVEIGEPSISVMEHKVLMVVGATGAGKSTLINGMVNYILGVTWKDDFRFKLIVDEVKSQTKSVTSEITAYTIFHMEGSRVPYNLTVIDTPGFGDTSGLERDKKSLHKSRNSSHSLTAMVLITLMELDSSHSLP